MSHYFILTDGLHVWTDKFISDLGAQWYPISNEVDLKMGRLKKQAAVREMRLFDVVIPDGEKAEDEFLSDIAPYKLTPNQGNLKWLVSVLRRVSKLEAVKKTVPKRPVVFRRNVNVVLLGKRKDEYGTYGQELI